MSDRLYTIRHWRQKADNDFKVARHEVEHDESSLETVCFHAQQTADKYLKAFLVYHNQEIPKNHTIIRLIKVCISINSYFQNLIEQEIDNLLIMQLKSAMRMIIISQPSMSLVRQSGRQNMSGNS